MQRLKLISYNIHKGFSARNRRFVLPQMRQSMVAQQPDIVCLQEVQGQHKKRKLKKVKRLAMPQTDFLSGQDWPHTLYAKNAVYGRAHHGNALMSRFPFEYWDNINVAFSSRASRSLLHGVIMVDGQAIHVICIHLGLFKAERHIQLVTLGERIKAYVPADAPLIIAGDFNDWRGGAEDYLEQKLSLKEVHKMMYGTYGKTYPARRPAFRVDRIYYRGLSLVHAQVLNGYPWHRLSDHLPLYAELMLT